MRWTAGLATSFAATLDDAYDRTITALTGSSRRKVTGGSLSVSAGVLKASVDLSTGDHRPGTVAGQLRALGTIARDAHRAVVVFVDELQAGDPTSLAALSAGFQETNGERLPIALIAVGLPTARARLRSIKGATFIERQRPVQIGNLEPHDARQALERPIMDSERDHDPDIFSIMLATCGGYPYAIQLVGEYTWDEAGDDNTITAAHAGRGSNLAQTELDTIYLERWDQLTERQRDYLAAVIEHLDDDGTAPSNLVAATYGASTRGAAQTRKALIETHQLLYSDAPNSLRLALPGLDDWIARQLGHP